MQALLSYDQRKNKRVTVRLTRWLTTCYEQTCHGHSGTVAEHLLCKSAVSTNDGAEGQKKIYKKSDDSVSL